MKKYVFIITIILGITFSQSYKVVDTGQKTFYNNSSEISSPAIGADFYGQDAQFNGYQPSYTNNGDGTVTDNVTGLMWQQTPDQNGDGVIDVNDKLSYDEAMALAGNFDLAGYNDWRLPTIKELYSLIMFCGVDPSGYNGTSTDNLVPFINTDYFAFGFGDTDAGERIIDAQFASSNLYVSTTMNGDITVFGVNFADGRIKGYPKGPMPGSDEDKGFYILFVRDNPDYGKNDFVDNGNGTISDKATGLMWQENDSESGMNWQDALSWVRQKNNANYLGYNDWRLPNVKELQSILDYTRSPATTNSAAIDPLFSCSKITVEDNSEDYPFYWSGTTHANMMNGSSASYVAFGSAYGWMQGPMGGDYALLDVHGAGAQRSDPKTGSADDYPYGHGPQGDVIRINNYVRLVRDFEISDTTDGDNNPDSVKIEGMTLFAPMGSTTTYLMNEKDENIKTWESDYRPGLSVYLLPDKSLIRGGSVGKENNSVFGTTGGAGGIVEKFDWDGNKLWEFEYNSPTYLLHHDVEYLPNGNILMISWELKTETEAVEAGRNPSLISNSQLWPDKIIEVKPEGSSGGTIVWEWKVWDHLIQDYDATKENYGVVSDNPGKINLNFVQGNLTSDWNHINGIDYNSELNQILLTVHNFSEIWIIDHNTTTEEAAGEKGDLLYRWGNPQTYDRGSGSDQKLFVPHDAKWIKEGYPGEGNITIFNNGQGRSDGNYSSVDEIEVPLVNGKYEISNNSSFAPVDVVWSYTSDPKTDFYADHISGAQRLKNGNTLICDGPAGTFFEVTSDMEKIWEFVNPYSFTNPQGNTNNSVFRAVRYYEEDFSDEDITSVDIIENEIPTKFELKQNYPNPFNPSTKIDISLPEDGRAELTVFNLLGEKVKNLIDDYLNAGSYTFTFDAEDMPSGIYFYRLNAGNFVQTKKMILVK